MLVGPILPEEGEVHHLLEIAAMQRKPKYVTNHLSYTTSPSSEPPPIATAWSMHWNAIASHCRHTAFCLTAMNSRTSHLRSSASVQLEHFARLCFS